MVEIGAALALAAMVLPGYPCAVAATRYKRYEGVSI
jgi:hypothetical protein